MKRPKYLENMDMVQDAITDAGSDGLYIAEIMKRTNLSYAAIQQATFRLRNLERIRHEYRGQLLHFTPA